MPKRNSFIHNGESTTPRRSPRLLRQKTTTEPPQQPKTPRRPADLKSVNFTSTQKRVRSSIPSSSTTIELASTRQSHRDSKNKSSKVSNESHGNSQNFIIGRTGLRRSSRLNNGVGGFRCLRRSARLSLQKIVAHELKDSPRKGLKKSSKLDDCLGDLDSATPGLTKSASVNDRDQSLRRSQRLLNKGNFTSAPHQKANRVESLESIDSDSDFSVEETDQIVDRDAKVEEKSIEKSSGKGEKMTRDVFITREESTVEGRETQVRNEDKSEDLGKRKRKRKRDENSETNMKGWTKEQEVALQRAYFAAKPTPHFWKKVSKLVPGKSAQDCFERIHRDHSTPPQAQPRSRAKTMKSSPLEPVSLSASILLKPNANKARRSSCLKSKSYLTQKSLRKLLQCHRKVDQDREGDIFSVLEPDVDFSTNAFQPNDVLSTPKQLNEKQGWLQSCTGTSSSTSHKKSFSRFSSPSDTDLVSPPVLKQVKNRVQHEKYIKQLRCREAKRRAAASARVDKSKTGKAVREESNVQKRGAVESAKIALVSEARDAIKKFQHSQANFMGIFNSDENIDDGNGVEDADDEDESQ